MTVHLLGASGFVGAGVRAALEARGEVVRPVVTPRVETSSRDAAGVLTAVDAHEAVVAALAAEFSAGDVVVVASGLPDATGEASDALFGANALVPVLALRAAERAGCRRLVHVSSAVVQGDAATLDSSRDWRTTTAYGLSKAAGEQALLSASDTSPAALELVVYRPPSVHAATRRVTRALGRIARSPLAIVPRGDDARSPQALLENVGSAVALLAVHEGPVPAIVHHPWEGVSVASLMEDLGGRTPLRVPRWSARAGDATLKFLGARVGRLTPHARRLEMLWFGQGQAPSWLEENGWTPVAGRERWREMGDELRG